MSTLVYSAVVAMPSCPRRVWISRTLAPPLEKVRRVGVAQEVHRGLDPHGRTVVPDQRPHRPVAAFQTLFTGRVWTFGDRVPHVVLLHVVGDFPQGRCRHHR